MHVFYCLINITLSPLKQCRLLIHDIHAAHKSIYLQITLMAVIWWPTSVTAKLSFSQQNFFLTTTVSFLLSNFTTSQSDGERVINMALMVQMQHGTVMVMTNLNHSGKPFFSSDVLSFLELPEGLAL